MVGGLFLDVPGYHLQSSIKYEVSIFTPMYNWENIETGSFDTCTHLADTSERVKEIIYTHKSLNPKTQFLILLKESHQYSAAKLMYQEDFE